MLGGHGRNKLTIQVMAGEETGTMFQSYNIFIHVSSSKTLVSEAKGPAQGERVLPRPIGKDACFLPLHQIFGAKNHLYDSKITICAYKCIDRLTLFVVYDVHMGRVQHGPFDRFLRIRFISLS